MLLDDQLLTERLAVRPFIETDTPQLVAIFADPMVARFVDDGLPLPADQAALWVTRSRENLARFGYGTGAIILRETDELIGWAGFARPGDGTEEIIYGFAQAHWGRGYGAEIVRALVSFARMRGIDPIRATVHTENAASIKLLLKNGFRLLVAGYDDDPLCDLYAI